MSVISLPERREERTRIQARENALASLTQAYEPFLDKLINNVGSGVNGEGTLSALSRIAQEAALAVSQVAFGAVLQDAASKAPRRAPCPICGVMVSGRIKARTIETRHGEITIERPYHYCKKCRQGFVPFDEQLQLANARKQDDLREGMLKLAAEVPFEKAADLFKNLTGIQYSDHAAHDLVDEVGDVVSIEAILPSRSEIEDKIAAHTVPGAWRPVMVLSADGAHLPMRPPGEWERHEKRGPGEWHEAKGFRAYLALHDRVVQIASWHQVCDEEEFGKAMSVFSGLFDHSLVRIALVADGAKWIWKHFESSFPEGRKILDYYHCKQHLWSVARAQFGDQPSQQSWVESIVGRLFYNEIDSVIWGLQRTKPVSDTAREEIRKLLGYFEENRERLDYGSARRAQSPLGSGAIESSNKQVCQVRMKRPGAWWGPKGVNKMLAIRCASVNGTISRIYAHSKREAKLQSGGMGASG
jgi:Uncharacterised protein family (UPF0236)